MDNLDFSTLGAKERKAEYTRKYRARKGEPFRLQCLARLREAYAKDPEKYRAKNRLNYLKHRDAINERKRAARAENPELARQINRVYNRRSQGLPEPARPCPPTCECCGCPPGKKALALDHCHETGAFRGWLCYNCNVGIGNLGDNTAGLQRAIDYLEGVKGSTVAKATGREFDLATSTIHWH